MPDPQPADLLRHMESLACRAGKLLMSRFRTLLPSEIEFKGLRDLVSAADRESERFLTGEIHRLFPGHGVLGEEFGGGGGDGDWLWYVDPLDGTTNFVHGHPMFCVSIAAAHRGRLAAGVVHAPALGDTFAAASGHGARRNGAPIRVARGVPLARAFLSTGFPYTLDDLAENNIAYFAHLAPRTLAIRRCGSAAIDLAYVAAGIYDGFWELGLGAWDLAAGALLVAEAGGIVTDLDGGEEFLRTGRIVAAEESLHAGLLAALREARSGARDGR